MNRINREDLEEFGDELMIGEGMFDASDFLPEGVEFCRRCKDSFDVTELNGEFICYICDDDEDGED